MLETSVVGCPYCGESIEVVIDCSIEDQDYIEDCQVCCHPIRFLVSIEENGEPVVQACREDE